jgi:hypothetical protein
VKRSISALLLACALSALAGCSNPPYVVDPLHEETRRDHLDAQWFLRKISDGSGLQAVELTYCPIEPNTVPVCRTAIVWRKNQSALIDVEPTALVPVPSPGGSPAPAPPPPAP